MTTCAEWATRLATLKAAELKFLTGDKVNMIQDGEKRLGKNDINLQALQSQIAIAQRHVDRCNGCRRGGAIRFMPVDC
jgi:hypothetical protein